MCSLALVFARGFRLTSRQEFESFAQQQDASAFVLQLLCCAAAWPCIALPQQAVEGFARIDICWKHCQVAMPGRIPNISTPPDGCRRLTVLRLIYVKATDTSPHGSLALHQEAQFMSWLRLLVDVIILKLRSGAGQKCLPGLWPQLLGDPLGPAPQCFAGARHNPESRPFVQDLDVQRKVGFGAARHCKAPSLGRSWRSSQQARHESSNSGSAKQFDNQLS